MSAKRDYYEVLGIDRSADTDKIKSAFRKLAKKYHPDRNAGDPTAADKFKEVTEAYDVLKDKEKRKLYDKYGFAAFDENGNPRDFSQQPGDGFGGYASYGSDPFGGGARTWNDGNTQYREYHFNGNDFKGSGFGGGDFSDIFSDLFGSGAGSRFSGSESGFGSNSSGFGGFEQSGMRGSDAEASLEVSFEEAAFGGERTVRLTDSSGRTQSLKVHIPAGIESGKKIRLKGKGGKGTGGAPDGDLYIRINAASKPGFERKGSDVYSTVSIPYTTAALGGSVIVPTLSGNVRCRIKEGTQSGTKIRLKGKGTAKMNAPSSRGDQYVTVEVKVPTHLSPKAKEKLMEFKEAAGM